MVVAQPRVAGETCGRALPAAVHGYEVDVHIDDEVALGCSSAYLHCFAVIGGADYDHAVRVFGIVIVETARRGERVIYSVAHGVAQLGFGHAAVEGQGGDDVDIFHACGCRCVEHGFYDSLADVGAAHRREGEGDVVESYGELHVGSQEGGKGFRAERVGEGVADGFVGIGETFMGFGRVDYAAAAWGELFQTEAFAVVEQDRRRGAVCLQHEAGARGRGVAAARVAAAHRAAPAGAMGTSLRGPPGALEKCSTSQPRRLAKLASFGSGLTATGNPTTSSIGRSLVESA